MRCIYIIYVCCISIPAKLKASPEAVKQLYMIVIMSSAEVNFSDIILIYYNNVTKVDFVDYYYQKAQFISKMYNT